MSGISRDEWLKALTDAGLGDQADDREALTLNEFAAMFNLPRNTAQSRMYALVRAGKATQTTKHGYTSYGRRIAYRAYKLTP